MSQETIHAAERAAGQVKTMRNAAFLVCGRPIATWLD